MSRFTRRSRVDGKRLAPRTGIEDGKGAARQGLEVGRGHNGGGAVAGRRGDIHAVRPGGHKGEAKPARRKAVRSPGAVGGRAAGGDGGREKTRPVIAEHRGRLPRGGIDQGEAHTVQGAARTAVEDDAVGIDHDRGRGLIGGIAAVHIFSHQRGGCGHVKDAVEGGCRAAARALDVSEKHARIRGRFP